MTTTFIKKAAPFALMSWALALGCAGPTDDGDDGDAGDEAADIEVEVPEVYTYPSRFSDGDSVSYSGQIVRHLLVGAMKNHLSAMTGRIDDGSFVPVAGDVVAELEFYYRFDSATSGAQPHGVDMAMPALQTTFDEVSSGKNLAEKLAGNDEVGQHVDWNGGFVGYEGASSPEGLVLQWFSDIDALAVARAQGDIALDPLGNPIEKVFVSPAGQDYQQLLQKFLLGAVMFSQAADDYLDDDIEGKGLLSDNTEPEEGKPYTALEHAWDEGFGYFGAARNYGEYTDEEIAGSGGRDAFAAGYHDASGDGKIDLTSEYNFGHSVNAGKRDLGAVVPTDFSSGAIEAFLTGRAIIAAADGPLSDEQLADLQQQRDAAIANWEAAIASTVVHYINDVLGDMGTFDTAEYSFADHAKHWSELKGFALSLQFNPRSPVSDADFARLHALVGDAPVLPGAEGIDAYRDALDEAKTLLGDAYGFDPANLGDAQGSGGW